MALLRCCPVFFVRQVEIRHACEFGLRVTGDLGESSIHFHEASVRRKDGNADGGVLEYRTEPLLAATERVQTIAEFILPLARAEAGPDSRDQRDDAGAAAREALRGPVAPTTAHEIRSTRWIGRQSSG